MYSGTHYGTNMVPGHIETLNIWDNLPKMTIQDYMESEKSEKLFYKSGRTYSSILQRCLKAGCQSCQKFNWIIMMDSLTHKLQLSNTMMCIKQKIYFNGIRVMSHSLKNNHNALVRNQTPVSQLLPCFYVSLF